MGEAFAQVGGPFTVGQTDAISGVEVAEQQGDPRSLEHWAQLSSHEREEMGQLDELFGE